MVVRGIPPVNLRAHAASRMFRSMLRREVPVIALKVIAAGGSLALSLPEEAVSCLKVAEGDTVHLLKAPDGSFRLTRCDPETERQKAAARNVAERRRSALADLSK